MKQRANDLPRRFSIPIPAQTLSNLLWAANGF